MKPFQGNRPIRLSPVLTQVLEGESRSIREDKLSEAVAALSRLFTKGREALGTDYLKDPSLAAAYLNYFLPVNLSKVQVLLDELPDDWLHARGDRPLRVLDLGTGPGTGAVAVLDWLAQKDPDSLKDLTVVAIDASAEALRQAQCLWTAYSRQIGTSGAKLVLYEADLLRPMRKGWTEEVARGGPYDLIIVANCLNEVPNAVKEKADLIADFLTQLTAQGTMMLLEPALRETSRTLHQVRDHLLADKRCTVYSPCLHERNCPALLNPDDWCHEERAWEPPPWIQEIDRDVGFIKDALKFSYLLLRTDGRTITQRSPETFRMVSELRRLKGDTRAWLCNELGRCEVGRLDRLESDANSAWDECQRGTIVQIEGMARKPGASLGRILENAAVNIVRSV